MPRSISDLTIDFVVKRGREHLAWWLVGQLARQRLVPDNLISSLHPSVSSNRSADYVAGVRAMLLVWAAEGCPDWTLLGKTSEEIQQRLAQLPEQMLLKLVDWQEHASKQAWVTTTGGRVRFQLTAVWKKNESSLAQIVDALRREDLARLASAPPIPPRTQPQQGGVSGPPRYAPPPPGGSGMSGGGPPSLPPRPPGLGGAPARTGASRPGGAMGAPVSATVTTGGTGVIASGGVRTTTPTTPSGGPPRGGVPARANPAPPNRQPGAVPMLPTQSPGHSVQRPAQTATPHAVQYSAPLPPPPGSVQRATGPRAPGTAPLASTGTATTQGSPPRAQGTASPPTQGLVPPGTGASVALLVVPTTPRITDTGPVPKLDLSARDADLKIIETVCKGLVDVAITDVTFSENVEEKARERMIRRRITVAGVTSEQVLTLYDYVTQHFNKSQEAREHEMHMQRAKANAQVRVGLGNKGLMLVGDMRKVAEFVTRARAAVCESISATIMVGCHDAGFKGPLEMIGIRYLAQNARTGRIQVSTQGHAIVVGYRQPGSDVKKLSTWGNHWFVADMWYYDLGMRNRPLWISAEERAYYAERDLLPHEERLSIEAIAR